MKLSEIAGVSRSHVERRFLRASILALEPKIVEILKLHEIDNATPEEVAFDLVELIMSEVN